MYLVKYRSRKIHHLHYFDLVEYRTIKESPPLFPTTELSAVYDLTYVGPEVRIEPSKTYIASTGIYMELPSNLCALILPNNRLSYKYGITLLNTPDIIDANYKDEVKVLLRNVSNKPINIGYGIKIARLLFVQYENIQFLKYLSNVQ